MCEPLQTFLVKNKKGTVAMTCMHAYATDMLKGLRLSVHTEITKQDYTNHSPHRSCADQTITTVCLRDSLYQ